MPEEKKIREFEPSLGDWLAALLGRDDVDLDLMIKRDMSGGHGVVGHLSAVFVVK